MIKRIIKIRLVKFKKMHVLKGLIATIACFLIALLFVLYGREFKETMLSSIFIISWALMSWLSKKLN